MHKISNKIRGTVSSVRKAKITADCKVFAGVLMKFKGVGMLSLYNPEPAWQMIVAGLFNNL